MAVSRDVLQLWALANMTNGSQWSGIMDHAATQASSLVDVVSAGGAP